MKYVLKILRDPDVTDPTDDCCQWKLVSFDRRSVHSGAADGWLRATKDGRIVPATPGLAAKARAGLFYVLDYYEHGSGHYSLRGEGMQCRWDTAPYAGVLVWEHDPAELPKGIREQSARGFLETYNSWANGEGMYYCLEFPDGEPVDSCGGFYGNDLEGLMAHAGNCLEPGDVVKAAGDLGSILSQSDMPKGVTLVDEFDEEEEEAEEYAWQCRN